MSSGWSAFVTLVTLLSMAGCVWLLFSNRSTDSTGEELDHEFDGIREYDNPLPAWWVSLFAGSVIVALAYVFYYPALGNWQGAADWSSAKEWQATEEEYNERFAQLYDGYAKLSPQELVADRRAMQTGRRLFLNNCSTCHGIAAKGSTGFPNLTDGEWIWGSEFAQIKHTIINGRVAAMPPWGQVLKPAQVDAVTKYVSNLSAMLKTAATDDLGKTTYNTYCLACHGAEGQGNAALGAPNLANEFWLYGGSMEAIKASIVNGRAGAMPAQLSILGDSKAHLLAAYIYSLRGKEAMAEPVDK